MRIKAVPTLMNETVFGWVIQSYTTGVAARDISA